MFQVLNAVLDHSFFQPFSISSALNVIKETLKAFKSISNASFVKRLFTLVLISSLIDCENNTLEVQ